MVSIRIIDAVDGETIFTGVTITKVHENGCFDWASVDGSSMSMCNPDIVSIIGANGGVLTTAQALPSPPASFDELQNQLLDTQIALAAVYETLAAMVGGVINA